MEKYTVCGFRIITMIICVGCQFMLGMKYVTGMYISEVLINPFVTSGTYMYQSVELTNKMQPCNRIYYSKIY